LLPQEGVGSCVKPQLRTEIPQIPASIDILGLLRYFTNVLRYCKMPLLETYYTAIYTI
jgi:hypothetical protein